MSAVRTNRIDPITVEVIGSALSSIVEEMGEALVRASFSTNIKERRDCSTALFDTRSPEPVTGRWLEENAAASDLAISAATQRVLDEIFRPGAAAGARYPDRISRTLGI